jgi:hypothetical protein
MKDVEILGACSTHGKLKHACEILVEKTEGDFEGVGVDGSIILKLILKKLM